MLNYAKIILVIAQLVCTSNLMAAGAVRFHGLPVPKSIEALESRMNRYDGLSRMLEVAKDNDGKLALKDVDSFIKYYAEKDPEGFFKDEMEFLLRRGEGTKADEVTLKYFRDRIAKFVGKDGFAHLIGAVEKYDEAMAKNPAVANVLPPALVLGELAENLNWWTGKRLVTVIEFANSLPAGTQAKKVKVEIAKFIAANLESWGVESADVKSRVVGFFSSKAENKIEAFERMLGKRTFEETKHAWYGENPLAPSEGSLIAKYVAATGAQIGVRTFPKFNARLNKGLPAEKYQERSPERLVVPVSAATFEEFKNTFLTREDWMSLPAHGTMLHTGTLQGYGGFNGAYRAQGPGNIVPVVLLSSNEGQRLGAFLHYKAKQGSGDYWAEPLGYPHIKLKGNYGMKPEDAVNCDTGCTGWNGNVQIGDPRVKSRQIPLGDYNRGKDRWFVEAEYVPHGDKSAFGHVLKAPGHASFSEVIGLGKQNAAGYFLSTGGTQVQLTGRASQERVPVVFVFVNDVTAALPEQIKGFNEDPM